MEEEFDDQFGTAHFSDDRRLPRLEGESLAEREFRIAVSQQICGLVRGYQDCLFFVSASQPVFNRDRFLRQAPALFEDRKGGLQTIGGSNRHGSVAGSAMTSGSNNSVSGRGGVAASHSYQRIMSPRSKRFLSGLVNTQHFHYLLEKLDAEETSFFHEVMDTFETMHSDEDSQNSVSSLNVFGSRQQDQAAKKLGELLDSVESKIPTYHVQRRIEDEQSSDIYDLDDDDDDMLYDDDGNLTSFTNDILQPLSNRQTSTSTIGEDLKEAMEKTSNEATGTGSTPDDGNAVYGEGIHQLSIRQLIQLDKRPWKYSNLFQFDTNRLNNSLRSVVSEDRKTSFNLWPKIQLKEAIGERKFR